jgi:alpha-ketoglutarate-dependent taurine dioxygenase
MMDEESYQVWRDAKLENYPRNVQDLLVKIGGLADLGDAEKAAIIRNCRRSNMAIYQCRDDFVDRAAVLAFAANFGLRRLDHHLCANDDGVSELSVASRGIRTGYVPYSNHSLSWHTDGYYNDASKQVCAVVLHCESSAAAGGENALFDPEIAYIRLRDENPDFITALEHHGCMTIPANTGAQGEIRPAVCGPIFSRDVRSGGIHMRYSARKKNIQWRDNVLTRTARDFLTEILADEDGSVFRYRLQAGEGLISNNVLHNRTAFEDGPGHRRLIYRARFYDRISSTRLIKSSP